MNSGIGICRAKRYALPPPFTLVNGSTRRRGGGTATCKQSAELGGGAVWVENGEIFGSAFWFLDGEDKQEPGSIVDGTATSAENGSLQEVNMPKAGNIPILLADDDPAARKFIPMLLKCHGYRVDVVSDGREAVHALTLNDYALVLMDCIMPGMDGYEATAIIRDPSSVVRRHDVPVIALTGNVMKHDREKCIAAGMNDHLMKPLNLDDLLAKLSKWLAT